MFIRSVAANSRIARRFACEPPARGLLTEVRVPLGDAREEGRRFLGSSAGD